MTIFSDDERRALDLSVQLAGAMAKLIGDGRSKQYDMAEMVKSIHDIQARIMWNAVSRIEPDIRPLGGSLE